MKTSVAALAVAVLSLGFGVRADAQTVVYEGAWGGTPVFAATGYTSYSSSYVPPTTYPYSYYMALPFPARGYVGLGGNDFPFYGRPYGYPTDPWSWAAMSTNPYGPLARYYYPPVR